MIEAKQTNKKGEKKKKKYEQIVGERERDKDRKCKKDRNRIELQKNGRVRRKN